VISDAVHRADAVGMKGHTWNTKCPLLAFRTRPALMPGLVREFRALGRWPALLPMVISTLASLGQHAQPLHLQHRRNAEEGSMCERGQDARPSLPVGRRRWRSSCLRIAVRMKPVRLE
jgi:hypothetical protein